MLYEVITLTWSESIRSEIFPTRVSKICVWRERETLARDATVPSDAETQAEVIRLSRRYEKAFPGEVV